MTKIITNLSKKVLCPVVDGKVISSEAEFYIRNGKYLLQNGWHIIDVLKKEPIREARLDEVLQLKSNFYAYSMQKRFVPTNFDNCRKAINSTKIEPLLLPESMDDLQIAKFKVIRNRVFYLGHDDPQSHVLIAGETIRKMNGKVECLRSIKGLSPEMIYVLTAYGIHVAEQMEKIKAQTLPERIKRALSAAGAKLIKFVQTSKSNLIDIVWSIFDYQFISTVQENDLRVYDAGLCISGADRKHSLSSLTEVTKRIIEDDQLHVTRHSL